VTQLSVQPHNGASSGTAERAAAHLGKHSHTTERAVVQLSKQPHDGASSGTAKQAATRWSE
jgi:hypothetical protein